MPGSFGVIAFGLVVLALEGSLAFAIVYFAARLAIRHERNRSA